MTRNDPTAPTATTRWAFVQPGDVVIHQDAAAAVVEVEYAAPWRVVSLDDGRTVTVRGSWTAVVLDDADDADDADDLPAALAWLDDPDVVGAINDLVGAGLDLLDRYDPKTGELA
jgi:hypothetical protein